MTSYSGRTGFAAICDALKIDDDAALCTIVREWYGHSDLSWQYKDYAKALGRLLHCLTCKDKENSVMCPCTGKRAPRNAPSVPQPSVPLPSVSRSQHELCVLQVYSVGL